MKYDEFIAQVRRRARLATTEEAEERREQHCRHLRNA